MNEIWKDVKGYENKYQVSNLGNVRSLNYHREGHIQNLKLKQDKGGYVTVGLCKNSVVKWKKVHRLVCKSFIPNPNNKSQVNHKDGDKTNNHVNNLEWSTASENTQHAFDNALIQPPWKGKCGKEIPLSKKVLQITTDDKLVKIWDSMSDVKREMDIPVPHIVRVCNGQRNKTRGYIWKRLEDLTEKEIKTYKENRIQC